MMLTLLHVIIRRWGARCLLGELNVCQMLHPEHGSLRFFCDTAYQKGKWAGLAIGRRAPAAWTPLSCSTSFSKRPRQYAVNDTFSFLRSMSGLSEVAASKAFCFINSNAQTHECATGARQGNS